MSLSSIHLAMSAFRVLSRSKAGDCGRGSGCGSRGGVPDDLRGGVIGRVGLAGGVVGSRGLRVFSCKLRQKRMCIIVRPNKLNSEFIVTISSNFHEGGCIVFWLSMQ